MRGKFKASLNSFAIMSDKSAKKAEIIETDSVYIEQLQIFMDRRLAQVTLRIGGIDSKGKFHPDHEYNDKIARMNVADPLFSELFIDNKGNMKVDINSDDFAKLIEEAIKGGDTLVWGFGAGTEISLDHPGKVIKVLLKK